MADFTNVSRSSSTGWIIGVIAVVAVLFFVLMSSGTSPTDPAVTAPEAVPTGADPATTAPAASE